MSLRSIVFIAAVTLMSGCSSTHGPVVDTTPKPEGVGGTIAGIVSAGQGLEQVAIAGRKVAAINQETGARLEVTTASNGGYTLKVPAGTYRLELELRSGERLAKGPETTRINVGDLDPGRDFVITR